MKTSNRTNRATHMMGSRAVVASLTGALLSGLTLLGGCSPQASLVGGDCAPGLVECGGACVTVAEDHENCGACGHACSASQQCGAGTCQAVQTSALSAACAADNTMCPDDGACRDMQHDPNNCGACGVHCAAGNICAAGACAKLEPGLRDCTPDNVRCGEACRDVRFDPSNCGSCGGHCAATDRCSDGVCVPKVACAEGAITCDGKCANLASDKANCGECGNACAEGDVCIEGACVGKRRCSL